MESKKAAQSSGLLLKQTPEQENPEKTPAQTYPKEKQKKPEKIRHTYSPRITFHIL